MNFPIHGYKRMSHHVHTCGRLANARNTTKVYHEGWAENGAILSPHKVENIELNLRYQDSKAGPLFWAQYSFLGLNPTKLKDKYCSDYFNEMKI